MKTKKVVKKVVEKVGEKLLSKAMNAKHEKSESKKTKLSEKKRGIKS